eukprot:5677087-Amphidinium_carterae.2
MVPRGCNRLTAQEHSEHRSCSGQGRVEERHCATLITLHALRKTTLHIQDTLQCRPTSKYGCLGRLRIVQSWAYHFELGESTTARQQEKMYA